MAKTIWKYPVGADDFSLNMPRDARILDVQIQAGVVQMWALVDPEAEFVTRHFITYGTGHPIENAEALSYIGTFQPGRFVFHLFEKDGLLF